MRLRLITMAAAAVLSTAAFAAQTYDYAVWSGSGDNLTGTVSGVNFTYSGPNLGILTNGANNYFAHDPADFTSSTVANAPAATDNFVQLQGGNNNTYTLNFSAPVTNLVVSVLSVGQSNDPVRFEYTTPFALISQGNDQWGSGTLSVSGNTLTGVEGSGSILFYGATSSLTWTLPDSEFWYGMTISTPAAVPDPKGLSVFAIGGIGLLIRRRKRA